MTTVKRLVKEEWDEEKGKFIPYYTKITWYEKCKKRRVMKITRGESVDKHYDDDGNLHREDGYAYVKKEGLGKVTKRKYIHGEYVKTDKI